MKGYYKVPFREVYCPSARNWLKELVWIFLVIKLFPCCVDLASDPLAGYYLHDPKGPLAFFEQYRFMIRRARRLHESEDGSVKKLEPLEDLDGNPEPR